MLYDIPFDIPDDTDAEYISQLADKHDIEFTMMGRLYGSAVGLIGFMAELDGPSQSFPVKEFMDWIEPYKVVPNRDVV